MDEEKKEGVVQNAVKQGGKKVTKKVRRKILITVLPNIMVILVYIIIACMTYGLLMVIKEAIFPSGSSIESATYYKIEDDGIKIDEQKIEELFDQMQGDDADYDIAMTGLTKKSLKKYLEASAASQNIKRGNSGVQGFIHVYKSNARNYSNTEESIKGQELSYKNYNSFIASPDDKHYSIDSSGNLVVATWKMNEKGGDKFYSVQTINIKSAISLYDVPLMFFVNLCAITQNPKFVEAVAEQVLKSNVILTLQETITEIEEEWEDKDGNDHESYEAYSMLNPVITYADTLFYRKMTQYINEEKVTKTSDEDSSRTETTNFYTLGPDLEPYVKHEEFKKLMKQRYIIPESVEYDEDKDKTLGEKLGYSDAYDAVIRNSSLFFNYCEENVSNEALINQFKYVLQIITNRGLDYGIEDLDLTIYFHDFGDLGGGDWVGGTKEEFIQTVARYAVADMEVHKIYASVTIAQAIVESGWGNDDIALKYHNFFGMKASATSGANEFWSGERVQLNASEGGKSYFRVYDSLKNSVFDHGRNFHVTKTYQTHGVLDCIGQNLGPKEQLRRIAKSGYAVNADGSIAKPDKKREYDQYLYEEFIVKYNLQRFDSMSTEDFKETTSDIAEKIISLAKSKLGSPYVYGAVGPNTFDCSGLIYWVYQQCGISVPRSTGAYKRGVNEVSMAEMQPGDALIIFADERKSGVGHAGIYIGNDQYIHAPQTGDVVKISSGATAKFKHVFRYWK